MAGDARLRLAENGDDFADGQLPGGKKRKNAQTGLLAGRVQLGDGGFEFCKGGGRGHQDSE